MQPIIQNQTDSKPIKRKGALKTLVIWCAVFGVSIAVLVMVNVAPPEIKEMGSYFSGFLSLHTYDAAALENAAVSAGTAEPVLVQVINLPVVAPKVAPINPVRVVIKKVGVDTAILNPQSADIKTLDEALLKGAVRYPRSGTLEDGPSIFLLGHSSYLKVINNKAYKAFNRIQELQLGDEVQLFSANRLYIYKVTKIELVDANDAAVNLSSKKRKVILSTCDSFGKKSDRFVVEATFAGSSAIPLNQR